MLASEKVLNSLDPHRIRLRCVWICGGCFGFFDVRVREMVRAPWTLSLSHATTVLVKDRKVRPLQPHAAIFDRADLQMSV